MFNTSHGSPTGFVDERVGYLFTYAQMCANQVIRLTHLESRPVPEAPLSRAKWTMDGKEAERLEIYISGVLSAALFFEAYSFDYVARKKSSEFAKKYVEKLDPPARWVLGTGVCAPPGLDVTHHAFGQMVAICRLRNKLVHNKTVEGDSFYPAPPIAEEFNPLACLKAIVEFCDNLKQIDPTESFASYVSQHVGVWMRDTMRGTFDYPTIANIDP